LPTVLDDDSRHRRGRACCPIHPRLLMLRRLGRDRGHSDAARAASLFDYSEMQWSNGIIASYFLAPKFASVRNALRATRRPSKCGVTRRALCGHDCASCCAQSKMNHVALGRRQRIHAAPSSQTLAVGYLRCKRHQGPGGMKWRPYGCAFTVAHHSCHRVMIHCVA